MPKFFCKEKQNNKFIIQGSDVKHIKNVLRKKIEDNINICDTETSENFLCKIKEIKNDEIICEIIEKIENTTESNIDITIFQGLPKSEKMELIIQKSVELGVNTITPTKLKRCIVKIDENKKIERWQKISEVAAKQSERDYIPDITYPVTIKDIDINKYDVVLVPYENEESNSIKTEIQNLKKLNKENLKIGIIIGPEGGFDESEILTLKQAGSKIITLGKRILRTETVAFTITSILMYELGDLN